MATSQGRLGQRETKLGENGGDTVTFYLVEWSRLPIFTAAMPIYSSKDMDHGIQDDTMAE
jgi:hypothetical protein